MRADVTAALPTHEYLTDEDVGQVLDGFYRGFEAHRDELLEHYQAEARTTRYPGRAGA